MIAGIITLKGKPWYNITNYIIIVSGVGKMAIYGVCLDPGHGGRDPGAVGLSGILEKNVNLHVAKQAAAFFKDNIQVFMTRDNDTTVELEERSRFVNGKSPDILISIHCNSAENTRANGLETYCYKFGGNGEILARSIQKSIVSATGLRNRGVKEGNLHMLRETNMPAVLVELGFLSNREEEALLRSSDFHIKCGRAIAEGIENYFRQVKVIRELQSIDVQYKSLNLEGYLIEGKAFVELRAFAEALDKRVFWDNQNKTAQVLD